MKISQLLAFPLTASAAVLQDPLAPSTWPHKIPSVYESAVMGRRILGLAKLGDLATIFPSSSSATDDASTAAAPAEVAGMPITMMDYLADCESIGNPTLLALSIGTTFRNAAAGSNVTLSLRWIPPYAPAKRMSFLSSLASWFVSGSSAADPAPPDTVPYSAANLPRVSLMGYIEPITPGETNHADLVKCFVNTHPDAKYWLPGNPIHHASWARLVVTQIYWVGGFGDRAYIGWIPVEDWNKVTQAEWQKIRLPGEKPGWSEWSIDL
ncbi:hypothetical protein TD95_005234 [Thielaviopsis punctulata]|uniref:CREG-like beta-barrel domain-containing protein n=1 Tax=Thielaviopsis punctulata TaxID=72032 RepID=A0A0F4ZDQ7_9PEZI|nr:hypothetical protein TD95_005234 [Thielaviopsis punctulata]